MTVGLTDSAPGPGGGRTAGVGVVAPRFLGLTNLDGVTTDGFSPPGALGRLAAAWTPGFLKGGLMLITAYFSG